MPEPRTALVAGATGLVGSHLLESLLDSPAYTSVTALVRRPLDRSHPKLHDVVVDFDRLDDKETGHEEIGNISTVHDIFCCLGTTIKKAGSQDAFRRVDHDYVVDLAKLGRRAGGERFLLVSSVDAGAGSSNFYLRVKGQAEDAVAALDYPALHIFRPSFLVGDRQERRPGEKLGIAVARMIDPLVGLLKSFHRYRAIEARDVARAMIAAATSGSQGHHVHQFTEIRRLAAGES